MDVIDAQFQNELLNIIQTCFHRPAPELKESEPKGQKRDVKGELLDKMTPFCVSYLEQRNFEIEKTSQFFNVPYNEITFGQLSKDFKLLHLSEYVPATSVPVPSSVYLCRYFMALLNRISTPDTTVTESHENIKNISIAIADLFLSINVFVLYHCAKQELASPQQNTKKTQSPQYTIITRIIDKLAPQMSDKRKTEAVKSAAHLCNDLHVRLIQYVELKRTSNEKYFEWAQLDKLFDRKDFSPIATIGSIRDSDKVACWESLAPVNFGVITIPLLCDNDMSLDDQSDLVSKLQHLIGDQKKRIQSSKFVVQTGTIGQTTHIVDLLSVEEREVGLSDMTWLQRIDYLKRSFNVTGDLLENYKIVEPIEIQIGLLNMKIQNEVPKHIVIKTLGFGMYRSFYSSPKVIKRPHDEKAQTTDEQTPDDSGKKIRF